MTGTRVGIGDPAEWPLLWWWLLALAVALAAATLGVGMWLAPVRAEARRSLAQGYRLQAEVVLEATRGRAWRALEPTLVRRGREQSQQLRTLPGRADLAAQVLALSRLARASGLVCEHLAPAAEEVVGDHVEQPLAIRLSGGYGQFVDFADALARAWPPIVLVPGDIALVRRPPGADQAPADAQPAPRLELSGSVRLLRRRERGDPAGAVAARAPVDAPVQVPPARLPPLRSLQPSQGPADTVGDPFQAAPAGSVVPVAAAIGSMPSAGDQLPAAVMVGRIGSGARADALVRTPDRQVHRLAVGSAWGAATVVQVLEAGVRLRTFEGQGQDGYETWIRRAGPGTEVEQ